jgi:hypothetical protein
MGERPGGQTIEFPVEGFRLHSDQQGLVIEVTDYHARPLRLPWPRLLELARQSGASASRERETDAG